MSEASYPSISTVRQLREDGYTPRSLHAEMRDNLISALRRREHLLTDLPGYEDTVIPQIENAILSGQDILLLGERGQAKSRIARRLTAFLDAWMPILRGSETNDDPLRPMSAWGRMKIADRGDDAEITWVGRKQRFAEKLATPDTSIADLIGEIDPIKVAEGRYLSNEEVLSFGLIPRTNRGIFNLNELPDLSERIQVGLLNILEERDFQIRGFAVPLKIDVMVVASANPEDYTNRGRIITPLKDRFGSQIRTHYPPSIEHELRIVDQEWNRLDVPGLQTVVPEFMRQIVAQVSPSARASEQVSQASGVSVRMTIANYEAMVASAQRRALLHGAGIAVVRPADLAAIIPTMQGKLELETFGGGGDAAVIDAIIGDAIRTVFHHFRDDPWVQELEGWVNAGNTVAVDTETTDIAALMPLLEALPDRSDVGALGEGEDGANLLAALEFGLEGLYRSGRIGRTATQRDRVYHG